MQRTPALEAVWLALRERMCAVRRTSARQATPYFHILCRYVVELDSSAEIWRRHLKPSRRIRASRIR